MSKKSFISVSDFEQLNSQESIHIKGMDGTVISISSVRDDSSEFRDESHKNDKSHRDDMSNQSDISKHDDVM